MTQTYLDKIAAKGKKFLQREFPSGTGAKALTISPMIAEELLENNPDNRSIKSRKVDQYAADMSCGRWSLNGESIIIASDGAVNDGQHRLWGCIQADAAFDTIVVMGVERGSRTTVDQGAARTASDYLGMENYPNAAAVSTIARLVLAYLRRGGLNHSFEITNSEILQFIGAHGDKLQEVFRMTSVAPPSFRSIASRTIVAVAAYILADRGDVAKDYLRQVMTGEEISQDDPAYRVRERLSSIAKGHKQARLEAIMRGWIAHRDGKQMKIVRITGAIPQV